MSMTLRSHLITLVLVAVLPLLLFSAIVVGLAADSERDATERGLRATGRAVSSAVDHTLDNAIGALEVLATSELLDGGDLPGFHKVAARALEGQRGWLSVAVVDRAGRQVLNTLRPTGAELPPPADARTVAAVLARRLPIVSDLIASDLPERAHAVVAVPVLRGRALRGPLLPALDERRTESGQQRSVGGRQREGTLVSAERRVEPRPGLVEAPRTPSKSARAPASGAEVSASRTRTCWDFRRLAPPAQAVHRLVSGLVRCPLCGSPLPQLDQHIDQDGRLGYFDVDEPADQSLRSQDSTLTTRGRGGQWRHHHHREGWEADGETWSC